MARRQSDLVSTLGDGAELGTPRANGHAPVAAPRRRRKVWERSPWSVLRLAEDPSAHMLERLSAAIVEQEERLAGLTARPRGARGRAAREHVADVLASAWRLRDQRRVLEGWQEVYEARLAMIDLYPPEDCLAYRTALREEARTSLSGGRRQAAERLLGEHLRTPEEAGADKARGELRMVRRIIDGHWQGVYLRAVHTRGQLFFLPIALAAALAALLAVSLRSPHPVHELDNSLLGNTSLLVWVYVCGALGALLSVTLGTIRGVTRQNYLLVSETRVNLTRPLLGAASAAAVVAILSTSLFNLGTGGTDRSVILAVSVAAGFSERLLTSAIAAVVHGTGDK